MGDDERARMSRALRRIGRSIGPIAAAAALLVAADPAAALEPVRLPAPTWPGPVAPPPAHAGAPRLEILRARANAITDTARWFTRNRLVAPEWSTGAPGDVTARPLPGSLPRSFRGTTLVRAVDAGPVALLVFGTDAASGRYVVGVDRDTGVERFAFDFGRYAIAPGTPARERAFARQEVVWAALVGRTLYVETAHATDARSSAGRTGYVTAVDVDRARVRWRSRALVANASTFAVVGDLLLTGYGFTGEPDAILALDRRTGRVLRRLVVPSMPEYLLFRRGVLFARTYDRDLVIRVVP